jgi:hypothetical protein
MVSKAFSTILVSTLCELVDMNSEEVVQQIKSLNWQLDETTNNSIKITSVIPDNFYQDQVDDDTKMILKLSDYIGHFEQKPIKVDLGSSK